MFRPGEPVITLDDPFSGTRATPPVSVWRLEPDRQERDVWQWSLDIQRELPGSRFAHRWLRRQQNQPFREFLRKLQWRTAFT